MKKPATLSEALDQLAERCIEQRLDVRGVHSLAIRHPHNDARLDIPMPNLNEACVQRRRLRNILLAILSEGTREALSR